MIPMARAKEILEKYELESCIILGRKGANIWTATYGMNEFHCNDADKFSQLMVIFTNSNSPEEFVEKVKELYKK